MALWEALHHLGGRGLNRILLGAMLEDGRGRPPPGDAACRNVAHLKRERPRRRAVPGAHVLAAAAGGVGQVVAERRGRPVVQRGAVAHHEVRAAAGVQTAAEGQKLVLDDGNAQPGRDAPRRPCSPGAPCSAAAATNCSSGTRTCCPTGASRRGWASGPPRRRSRRRARGAPRTRASRSSGCASWGWECAAGAARESTAWPAFCGSPPRKVRDLGWFGASHYETPLQPVCRKGFRVPANPRPVRVCGPMFPGACAATFSRVRRGKPASGTAFPGFAKCAFRCVNVHETAGRLALDAIPRGHT